MVICENCIHSYIKQEGSSAYTSCKRGCLLDNGTFPKSCSGFEEKQNCTECENYSLIINGEKITDLSEIKTTTLDWSTYQLVLIDNQTIQNKLVIFRDNKVYITADLKENADIYNHYPKNELVNINHCEVSVNAK